MREVAARDARARLRVRHLAYVGGHPALPLSWLLVELKEQTA